VWAGVRAGPASENCSEPQCWEAVGELAVGVVRHLVGMTAPERPVVEQQPKRE